MDLLALPGNSVKLYLLLHAHGASQTGYRLSLRELSRRAGLCREATDRALGLLEQAGLAALQDQTCRVDPAPLARLLAATVDNCATATAGSVDNLAGTAGQTSAGRENQPPRIAGGQEDRPPVLGAGTSVGQGGKENRPPALLAGTSMDQPAMPSTRTRTSWSSSGEEDGSCTTPLFSPPAPAVPSQTGTNQPEEAWMGAMLALWHRVAPDHPHDPRAWLQRLHRTYGPQIPQAVLTAFAQDGRTLSQLEHPRYYRAWFETCCSQRCQRRPAAGTQDWLRRWQERTGDAGGRRTDTAEPHEPVPLSAVLTQAVPTRATAAPVVDRPADAVSAASTPVQVVAPSTASSSPARPTTLMPADVCLQQLRAAYEAQRDRAWNGHAVPAPSRQRRSRRLVPDSRPPATGPPPPDR